MTSWRHITARSKSNAQSRDEQAGVMAHVIVRGETRTPEQVKTHYLIERDLAAKLREAPREERRHLYASLYNELYLRVPHHPQMASRQDMSRRGLKLQLAFLRRFLQEEVRFLEIGAGDCALSLMVAGLVKTVYAADVSAEIAKPASAPANLHLILFDGCTIPMPDESVDVAYSNQVMEHLHPEDALEQLTSIYRTLAPGGKYICVTPDGMTGPHDVSRAFDDVATGFHLKEYTVSELTKLFRSVGFSSVHTYIGAESLYVQCPVACLVSYDRWLAALPYRVRKTVSSTLPLRLLSNIRVVGMK
jgi:SAM-dependent methyltransferase